MEDVLKAITGLEKTIEEKSSVTAKEIKEAKDNLEKATTTFNENWEKVQGELKTAGATIGQLQEEVKNLQAKNARKNMVVDAQGAIASVKSTIYDALEEKKEIIKAQFEKKGTDLTIEMKAAATVTSANLSGTAYRTYMPWQPGMEPVGTIHIDAFLRRVQSETDFISYPRANTPIGEGSVGAQASETTAKNQVDRDYTMIDKTLQTIAGWIDLSRASLRNIVFLQSWLPTSLMEQLQDNEDTIFSAELTSGATGSTTFKDGTTNIGKIVGSIANLIKAKYNPGAIAAGSGLWQTLLLTKSTDGIYSLPNVVVVDPNGNVRILGRPIIPVNWISDNNFLTGDWSRAAIVESQSLVLRQTDSDADKFTKNIVTWLLERTEGLMLNRPDAFIYAAGV